MMASSARAEYRILDGSCICGTPVRWEVVWDPELGALPPGTPRCDDCSEVDAGAWNPAARSKHGDRVLDELEAAGVNVELWGTMSFRTWDPSDDPHAIEAARELVRQVAAGDKGAALYLWGTVGNGKTALAVACIRQLIETYRLHSQQVRFVRAREFLRELGDAYREGGASRIVRRAKAARLLVIDEFGREPPTEHSAAMLSEVIEERRGSTIITSNHSLEELMLRYSQVDGMEHLISRLGPRDVVHLEFTGPDRRFWT